MKESIFMIDLINAKMNDKEKLRKLVKIIGDLLKVEGNEWLVDEILKTLGEKSPIEEIAKHPLLQNIHEYCVEQIIEKQAKEFYASFPISEIKDELIKDYMKMEHERRRDDFESYCLCIYQQIECISNFIFKNVIEDRWEDEKNSIAIKSFYNVDMNEYQAPKSGGTTLQKLIFGDSPHNLKWYAGNKFKAVLYFSYFNMNVRNNNFDFNKIYYVQDEIYQMRCQNHRYGETSNYTRKIVEKIKSAKARYCFKFYGFLEDFVGKIESSYVEQPNSDKKRKKYNKTQSQKNTLGEIFKDQNNKKK